MNLEGGPSVGGDKWGEMSGGDEWGVGGGWWVGGDGWGVMNGGWWVGCDEWGVMSGGRWVGGGWVLGLSRYAIRQSNSIVEISGKSVFRWYCGGNGTREAIGNYNGIVTAERRGFESTLKWPLKCANSTLHTYINI